MGGWGGYAGDIGRHRFSEAHLNVMPAGTRYGIRVGVPENLSLGVPHTYHGGSRGKWVTTDLPDHAPNLGIFKQETHFERVKSGSVTNPGRWPVITHADWREYIVGMTAHEGKHIEQFRNNLPTSEIRCEYHEQWMLKRYREEFVVPIPDSCSMCERSARATLTIDYRQVEKENVSAPLCESCAATVSATYHPHL